MEPSLELTYGTKAMQFHHNFHVEIKRLGESRSASSVFFLYSRLPLTHPSIAQEPLFHSRIPA